MKLDEKLTKAQNQLAALDEMAFDHLEFDWEGIKFHAATDINHSGQGHVHLKASLGRLYFTVENSAQRAMAIERLYTTNRGIDGNYAIGPKGDVSFKSITRTEGQLTGTELMCALTTIILEAENHLRALRSHLKAH